MDQKLDQYIQNLVAKCLEHPNFAGLAPDQKQQTSDNLTNHFYDLIMDTVIDNLTPEQLDQIKDLSFDSPEMEVKITEFTSQMPDFLTKVDQKLSQEAENIKNSGQIPQETQN